MNFRSLLGASVRIICSLICAGIFYYAWMAVFLQVEDSDRPFVRAILWLLAPVVTATGFATGVAILQRLSKIGRTRFLRILLWPLIGCIIGAGAVYWFGPMLIVFGMFLAGTASVALREAVVLSRSANAEQIGGNSGGPV